MNIKYGTYTTLDAPTKHIEQALAFLKDEFSKIDGRVFKLSNPHDFGEYPSFEVDYPYGMELVDDDYSDDLSLACNRELLEKETWHEQADRIESLYNAKFSKYL